MPQDKAAGAAAATATCRLDDEASPLLLHHQITASASDSSSLNKNKRVVAVEGYDEDSGSSTLLMLEATAKAPPLLQSSTGTSLLNKNKGGGTITTARCGLVDAESSALVMLVSTTSAIKAQAASADIMAAMDEKQPTNLWERYNRALEKNPFLVKSITSFFILSLGDLCGQAVEQHLNQSSSNDVSINNTIATPFQVDWPRTLRFGLLGLVGAPWSHFYFLYLDRYLPPTPSQPCSWITILKLIIDQGMQAPAILAIMICVLAIMKGTATTTTTAASGWAAARVQEDMQANYWNTLVANCKSCTNYLYFGSSSSSQRAATAAAFGRRVHAVFGLKNNSTVNDGGTMAYLHEHCYQHCLSSRSLHNLVLRIITGKLWIPASLVNLAFVKPTLRVLYVNVVFFLWTIILSMILN